MDKELFGAFIARNRKRAGMTQKDLASLLRVTDKAVSKWERGLSFPDVTLLEPLAAAFGLDVAELVACRPREAQSPPGRREQPPESASAGHTAKEMMAPAKSESKEGETMNPEKSDSNGGETMEPAKAGNTEGQAPKPAIAPTEKTAEGPGQEREALRNLLDLSGESLRRERRRGRRWALVLASALLLALIALPVSAFYAAQETVTGEKRTFILKEERAGERLLYVEEDGHLLRLRCAPGVDFDAIEPKNQWGQRRNYLLDYRWNRRTLEGTLTRCEATNEVALGGLMDEVGSAFGLDEGERDALFGYSQVSFEIRSCYPNPHGAGYLYTYAVWRGEGDRWNAELLLSVDCLFVSPEEFAYAAADWDGDGVTELLIRTRWPERPAAVYDLENGVLTETWLEEVPAELTLQGL